MDIAVTMKEAESVSVLSQEWATLYIVYTN